jgi:CRISPR-associated endonuclease/helicase Cas3
MDEIYAHTPGSNNQWHLLADHLREVANLAREFAGAFGAGELAYWLGLWHDLGKCNPAFQDYLHRCHADPNYHGRGPDHKAAGAQIALQHLQVLALLIQGHHGGLRNVPELKKWLNDRLKDPATNDALERARKRMPRFEPEGEPALPDHIVSDKRAAELFLRMLFSALVDADFLDTERHRNAGKAAERTSNIPLASLWERFEHDQNQFSGERTDIVGQARHAMYEACLAAADTPPGFFRLAMPTGGGKTRSAMAFALRHALHNTQRRVIVAVPFISITQQTAATYHDIFGRDDDEHPVVLEHHSGAGTSNVEPDQYDPHALWSRLAAENWDAPIVVTTTVQLFESLFANQTSRSRKLHRLAGSVIILDEAQALPSHLLQPILDGLQELCKHYNTTVVISTATQPAFESIPAFASLAATDIVPDAAQWFTALKRVNYEWRTDHALTWSQVAELMRTASQALVVVNTKKDALALLDALDDPDALHLSTLLCGAHRRQVIAEVKRRLAAGETCRLVSTQVIEAGVDLDFPLVLRALGPLDSIIQAAGRCNREGMRERGRVIVFRPAEGSLPAGAYRAATDLTGALLGQGEIDPDDPAVGQDYFRQLFATLDLDRERIQKLREAMDYLEVGHRFRMIPDDTEDVVVAYGSDKEQRMVQRALEQLQRKTGSPRLLLRNIQPYLVSIPTYMAERYRRERLITPVIPGLGNWLGAYDLIRGITGDDLDRNLLVI